MTDMESFLKKQKNGFSGLSKKDIEHKLSLILSHKEKVKNNCLKLVKYFLEEGENDLAIKLAEAAYSHDNSKLRGIEFIYLNDETKENNPEAFKNALLNHVTQNSHHPESHNSFSNMPEICIAEMAADIFSRSEEFQNNPMDWIKQKAIPKYNIDVNSKQYQYLKTFITYLENSHDTTRH